MKTFLSSLLVLGLSQAAVANKTGGRDRMEGKDAKEKAERTMGAQSKTAVTGIRGEKMDADVFKMLFGSAKASADSKFKKYDDLRSTDKEIEKIFSEMESFLKGRSYESEEAKVAANVVEQLLVVSKDANMKAEAIFLKDLLGAYVATGNLKLAVEDAAQKTPLDKLRLGEEFKSVDRLEKRLKEECRKG
jgi:hypothetical protein